MSVIEGALRRAGITMNPNAQTMVVDPSITGELVSAISNAVAGNGDLIMVGRGGHETSATIDFNKSGLRIFAVDDGLNPLARGEFNGVYGDSDLTDAPAVQISAPCHVRGLGFASQDTGSLFFSGAACLIGGVGLATPFGVWIDACRFPKWNLANRIGLAIEGSSDVLVSWSSFEGVGSALEAGIYIQGAMQNLTLLNNHFRQCTAAVKAGAFAGGGPHLLMGSNVVEDGLIIDTQGGTANGFIYDNYSELAASSSYDAAVGTLQGKGWQISGNHYAE